MICYWTLHWSTQFSVLVLCRTLRLQAIRPQVLKWLRLELIDCCSVHTVVYDSSYRWVISDDTSSKATSSHSILWSRISTLVLFRFSKYLRLTPPFKPSQPLPHPPATPILSHYHLPIWIAKIWHELFADFGVLRVRFTGTLSGNVFWFRFPIISGCCHRCQWTNSPIWISEKSVDFVTEIIEIRLY